MTTPRRFTVIKDSTVILRRKGIYKQALCYLLGEEVYAGFGGGFIRLMRYNQGTSAPDVTWQDLALPGDAKPSWDSVGRMTLQVT